MTYERIRQLSEYIPSTSDYYIGLSGQISSNEARDKLMNKFIWCYKDLAFGYHFVKKLIKDGKRLPACIDEPFLIDAYNYEKHGKIRYKNDDIVRAIALTIPCMRSEELALQAFLLKDISYEDIEGITSIPVSVIRYYENLFFNIRDRRSEALMIASTIYPSTRLVEYMDGYIRNEALSNIFLRSANKGSISDIKYMVGLTNSNANTGNTSEQSALSVEATLMANAAFLANVGLATQTTTASKKAENMLIAVKQSGAGTNTDSIENPMTFSSSIANMLMKDKAIEAQKKSEAFLRLSREDKSYEKTVDAVDV